jgi:nitrite reductase/ring-hydroxylating ferredoxin subunit
MMGRSASTERTTTVLCRVADIPENGVRRVVVAGYAPLAVFNLDGHFYAVDDRCSHGNGSLSAGFIEGGSIVCPLHFGSFDIRTGEPVDPPCSREISTYRLTIEAGDVMISTG